MSFCSTTFFQLKQDHFIDMPIPRLPPHFHRPEIPKRVLPRRCIDYLRFRKSFSSRSLSISNSFFDDGAMKKERDSAIFSASSFWDYEAVKRKPNQRSRKYLRHTAWWCNILLTHSLCQFYRHPC